MSEIVFRKTPDNINIELIIEKALNPKGIVLVWPCTMGDVRMYRMPAELFSDKGYTSILYNPRGHGNSDGQFSILDAINDFQSFITDFNDDELPLISVGHSGGCGGLLNIGTRLPMEKFYLAAPVLDSRKSLFHMYGNGAVREFNMMVAAASPDQEFVLSVLDNTQWLEPEYWRENNLQERLDAVSGEFMIGRFLDRLFIKGMSVYKDLESQNGISELLLPSEDKWYPLESTRAFASKHEIAINDNLDAHDHYLTRAWKNVWQYVLETI